MTRTATAPAISAPYRPMTAWGTLGSRMRNRVALAYAQIADDAGPTVRFLGHKLVRQPAAAIDEGWPVGPAASRFLQEVVQGVIGDGDLGRDALFIVIQPGPLVGHGPGFLHAAAPGAKARFQETFQGPVDGRRPSPGATGGLRPG